MRHRYVYILYTFIYVYKKQNTCIYIIYIHPYTYIEAYAYATSFQYIQEKRSLRTISFDRRGRCGHESYCRGLKTGQYSAYIFLI